MQSREDLDLTAGRGIAVREFPMKSGTGVSPKANGFSIRAVRGGP